MTTRLPVGAALVAASALMRPVLTATSQERTINVDDGRPLAAAVLELEKQQGWVVTYEDPLYVESEGHDVSAQVRRSSSVGLPPKVLVPTGGPLSVTYQQPAKGDLAAEGSVVRHLVDAAGRSGYGHGFLVRRTGTVFHVIPLKAKDARTGALVSTTSALDFLMKLEDRDYSVMEVVEAVVARSKGRLVIGMIPSPERLMKVPVHLGTKARPATQLLVDTLQASPWVLSWRILCGPGDASGCVLNIHQVRPQ